MSNCDLEQQVIELRQEIVDLKNQLAEFKKIFQKADEEDALDMLKVQLDVEAIQKMLSEYDLVHAAAFGGYFATHPEVRQDLRKVEDIIGLPPELKQPKKPSAS